MGKGSRKSTRTKRSRRTSDTHNAASLDELRDFQQDARHSIDDADEMPKIPDAIVEKPTVVEVPIHSLVVT